jgi:hypothetical protein
LGIAIALSPILQLRTAQTNTLALIKIENGLSQDVLSAFGYQSLAVSEYAGKREQSRVVVRVGRLNADDVFAPRNVS